MNIIECELKIKVCEQMFVWWCTKLSTQAQTQIVYCRVLRVGQATR